LNRVELVGEAMRHALNTLALVAPDWLRGVSQEECPHRYARRAEDDRLPGKQAAREALTLTIGNDGTHLLRAVYQASAPTWLREVSAIDSLRRMWIQNYQWEDNQLRWRASDAIPPSAHFLSSPYDLEAHYARKHTTQWSGYKVHLTKVVTMSCRT
jgi:transposase